MGASLICRNEQANIEDCINGILKQTVQPKRIHIFDDGSTDNTVKIINELKENHPQISVHSMNVPRHFKGWNIAYAIHQTLIDMMNDPTIDIIIRMDADAQLANPHTYAILLESFRQDPKLGITGAYHGKKMVRHVCDAVRAYRRTCLEQIIRNNPLPGQEGYYPLCYGHDSLAVFRANYHGWDVYPSEVQYHDVRPYKRNVWQWYQTGYFRHSCGFGFAHEMGATLRYIRAHLPILGTMVSLIAWGLSHLRDRYGFEPEFRAFCKKEFDAITIEGVKRMFRKPGEWIY